MQPVLFALVVHIAAFSLSAGLPKLLDRKPILDEVVTVNLVSLPETSGPPPQQAPAKNETMEPAPVIKPEAAVKIPIEPKAPVVEPLKEVKPVSLKPIKRKVRRTDPEKLAREEAERRREQERLKALAEAKREEERARLAAEEARSALAEMIRQKGVQQSAASSRRSSGNRQVSSIVEQNYYAALYDRVQQFWVLPEMKQWNPTLETRLVATILRDGTIARTVVEKRSGDPFFDQYAMKTLQKAVPLPRFPKLMTQKSIEIGFRFRPGELSTM